MISRASKTPIKHISGCKYSQPKRKTNVTKYTSKHHFTPACSLSTMPCLQEQLSAHANDKMIGGYANAISLDLHSTTVNGRTDGRQQRRARHLWQRGKPAAILSEAVPIWMETTTLHYSDDGSSLGAVGAHCCCSLANAFKAKHIQIIRMHKLSSDYR